MSTEKKNQHYLPKFYLRNFSINSNQKQIGVFNIASKFFHQTAKLKTQGSKNFFYGHDGIIENNLSNIEGSLATILKNILTEKMIPVKMSTSHIDLLAFVGLTDLRNPIVIQNIIESNKQIKQRLLELHPETDVDNLVPIITQEDAIETALSGLEAAIENMIDLDYKLLINKTKIPFLTSDFPIVKYNQFLEERRWKHGKTGYGCTGLQIVIPLNPDISIILYDSMVYKVGNRHDNHLNITLDADVNQLNLLQFINCFENIFFNESIKEHYLNNMDNKSKLYKKANQSTSGIHDLLKPDREWSKMLSIGSTDCEIELKIAGINKNSRATGLKLNPTLAQLRARPLEYMKKLSQSAPQPGYKNQAGPERWLAVMSDNEKQNKINKNPK